jgi:hypothetical protein
MIVHETQLPLHELVDLVDLVHLRIEKTDRPLTVHQIKLLFIVEDPDRVFKRSWVLTTIILRTLIVIMIKYSSFQTLSLS